MQHAPDIEVLIEHNSSIVSFFFNSQDTNAEFILIGQLPKDNITAMHQCSSKTNPASQIQGLNYENASKVNGSLTMYGTKVDLTLNQLANCGFWQIHNNMEGIMQGFTVSTRLDVDGRLLSYSRNAIIINYY